MARYAVKRLGLIGLYSLMVIASKTILAYSMVGTFGTNIICNNIPGLVPKQRGICNSRPDAMVAISEGAQKALEECQWQFQNTRWNCSLDKNKTSLQLGENLPVGSREAGYAYTIKSAGTGYYITQGCSKGKVRGCSCDPSRAEGRDSDAGWKWGGCSADINYGIEFSRIFMDAAEQLQPRSLMNLHNNGVGRQMLRKLMETECKCHGTSSSCALKTCWTTLPPFRKVGDEMMVRYQKAKQVESVQLQKTASLKLLRTKRYSNKTPRKTDMVFLDKSPNYCEYNRVLGSLGTQGRRCNKTSTASDGCHLMCCGRGYNTHEYISTWQCDCKFYWCCHVSCKECTQKSEIYSCK